MIHERIKLVRKSLSKKTSQEAFGDILGVSRDAIANIELGRVPPTNPFIQLLCLKFDINENWLRTGEGEMFEELDRDEAIVTWAAKVSRDDFDNEFIKKFATMMATLTEKEWDLVEAKMRWLVESKKD